MSERLRLRDIDLAWRSVDGELVALDLYASEYLAVNASGRILWEALGRGTTRAGLVQCLIDEYALSPEAAERHTDAFLAELRRRGLLDRVGNTSSRAQEAPR
jgi:hypothetical protein